MNSRHHWLILLVLVGLIVAACAPQVTSPPPGGEGVAGSKEPPPTEMAAQTSTAVPAEKVLATEPASAANLTADSEDWRVLGSPDAPVTMVEYSDFQ